MTNNSENEDEDEGYYSLITNPFPDKPIKIGLYYDNICANCDKSCSANSNCGDRYNLIYGGISNKMFFKHKSGWISPLLTSALYICDKCKDILDPMGEKIYYGSKATLKIKNRIFYNCDYIDRINDH